MFTNSKSTYRAIRKALLGTILAGATMFSATGCDESSLKDVDRSLKDVGRNAARLNAAPPLLNITGNMVFGNW